MKTVLFLLTTLVFNTFLFSQEAPNILWEKSYGGSALDQGREIFQTDDGGYIIVGHTESSDGDINGENNGTYDYWIIKIDSEGNIEWEKNYGGTLQDVAHSIKQTTDGGYIIAGRVNSNDGDVSNNNGLIDAWVLKLDSNGEIEWENSYGGSLFDIANVIHETPDGGYIFAGDSNSSDGDISQNQGSNDFWAVKLEANGVIEWSKTYGGSEMDYAYDLKPVSNGGYILVGATSSSDGDVSENNGLADYWVVKVDDDGEIEWENTYGGSDIDFAVSVCETNDGNFLIAGSSRSFDGDVSQNYGEDDYWILKIDSSGELLWEKNYGGTHVDVPKDIQETSDGGIIVIGYTASIDVDITDPRGGFDIWVIKLDSNGELSWQKSLGGTGADDSWSIQQNSDGSYIFAGYSGSTDGDISQNIGGDDVWVVKLEAESLSTSVFDLTEIILYPNPTTGIINIKAEEPITQAAVYTINGRKLPVHLSEADNTIDISDLSAGIYFVRVTVNNHSQTYKVIKQ